MVLSRGLGQRTSFSRAVYSKHTARFCLTIASSDLLGPASRRACHSVAASSYRPSAMLRSGLNAGSSDPSVERDSRFAASTSPMSRNSSVFLDLLTKLSGAVVRRLSSDRLAALRSPISIKAFTLLIPRSASLSLQAFRCSSDISGRKTSLRASMPISYRPAMPLRGSPNPMLCSRTARTRSGHGAI